MKRPMTPSRWLGLIAAGLFPAAFLVLGLYLITFGSAILTLSYGLTYLLLPALCLLLLWLTIRSRWHILAKWIFCLLILGLSYLAFVFCATYGHYSLYETESSSDCQSLLTHYQAESGRQTPTPEDLGQPISLEYHYFYNQWGLFFDSEYFALICAYAPEDYAALTARLDSQYTFHTAPLDAGDTDIAPLYTLDGYAFRFLQMDTEMYRLTYPQYMILVGTNDTTHEIVWSYYDDDDLDYISDPERFLLEDCGWKYIR